MQRLSNLHFSKCYKACDFAHTIFRGMFMKIFKKFFAFFLVFCSFFAIFQSNLSNFAKNTSATTSDTAHKMCIVIDDFGSYDESGVDLLSTCKAPLTCAVIPNVDNSKKHAELMKKNGHEIILHMPMEAHVNLPLSWYGPTYIKNSDSTETATEKLEECLKLFPDAKGFNVHIGSGVTKNKKLMSAIYEYANAKDLYFLDSRTIETHATEDACKDTSSVYLGRDVFLEADKNRSYQGVKKRLIEGANLALSKGYSIVIGHVGAEGGKNTAQAILDTIDEIEKTGVKIVPLSEIYEDIKNNHYTSLQK